MSLVALLNAEKIPEDLKKTTEKIERIIVRESKKDPFLSSTEVAKVPNAQLAASTRRKFAFRKRGFRPNKYYICTIVLHGTIRKILVRRGLRNRIAANKNPKTRRKSAQNDLFGQKPRFRNANFWNSVIFWAKLCWS